jgi:hypothetical protein
MKLLVVDCIFLLLTVAVSEAGHDDHGPRSSWQGGSQNEERQDENDKWWHYDGNQWQEGRAG